MNPETQPKVTSTRPSKRAYWSHHVDRWQISGLTQVQYCQENQLNQHTFRWPEADVRSLALSNRELSWLLDGLDIRQQQAHRPLQFTCVS
jgi:hypothetical protein